MGILKKRKRIPRVYFRKFSKVKPFAVVLLLLLLGKVFAVTYEVQFSFLPAGKIEITKEDSTVLVKGKSAGLVGWFYKYKLKMLYKLDNETASFMEEYENGKERFYDFKRILKKKPWLPVVVRLIAVGGRVPEKLKVGNLTIVFLGKEKDAWRFAVLGSKRVKEVLLKGWKPGSFPERIEILTKAGTMVLVKR